MSLACKNIHPLFPMHTLLYSTCTAVRFNAQFYSPGTEGVDEMARSWVGENNYVNPPWSMLSEVAQKLRDEGAAATVVAPCWVTETW